MTETEEELLLALIWLLRVSQGDAHDDDDLTEAHRNAEKLIDKYEPVNEDDEDDEE